MAELVTGHAGKAHATAEQAAGLNAGILGLDDYVLDVHDKLKITVVSANKVTIGTGELVMQGRHVSQGTPEDLIVTNGSQGQKRNDLIVCRYAKGSQNIESAKLVVVRGTPTTGTPTDPAVNTTSPLDGGTTYDMPLYRIPLDGITIGTPVALFNVLKPMSDVWDSLTLTSNPVVSQFYPSTLPVRGNMRAGIVTLHISGSNVVTYATKDSVIAKLTADARPAVPVRVLFGVQGSSWGLFVVNTNGEVTVRHRYGGNSLSWDFVDISTTYVTA